jgi:hypothetical protein
MTAKNIYAKEVNSNALNLPPIKILEYFREIDKFHLKRGSVAISPMYVPP